MTNYYLPADLSRIVDEKGGKDYLIRLVTEDQNPVKPIEKPAAPPRIVCAYCGIRLKPIDAEFCSYCHAKQP